MKIVSVSPVAVIGVVAATAAVQAVAITLDLNTIILAVIGLIGTSVTGFLALRVAALGAESKKIHVAVNSGKTEMQNKIDELHKLVLEQSGIIKTLEEKGRGAELAKALASVPPVVVMSTMPPPAPVAAHSPARPEPSGKLENAIVELTAAAKDTVESAEKTVDHAAKIPKP